MKKLLRYYLFLERGILTLFLTLVYIFLIVVAILAVQNAYSLSGNIEHYYHVRDRDKASCLGLQNGYSDPNHRYEWRDNTFLGFGNNHSYGCFLIVQTPTAEKKGN